MTRKPQACRSWRSQPPSRLAERAGAQWFLLSRLIPKITGHRKFSASNKRDGSRVVVLDGDLTNATLCTETLRGLGCNVETLTDAENAAERIATARPELVILDLDLPGGNGLDILEAIKTDHTTRHTSVIFTSHRNVTADKVEAFRRGADDYLVKPLDPLELAARIEKILRRRQ
ncbi:MAG: response regulator transcription factor [Myxococcota bacterium]